MGTWYNDKTAVTHHDNGLNTMTVAELIIELQKLDHNAKVMRFAYDGQTVIEFFDSNISLVHVTDDQSFGTTHIEKYDHNDYNAVLLD